MELGKSSDGRTDSTGMSTMADPDLFFFSDGGGGAADFLYETNIAMQ